jgi:hypothetical protein
MGCKQSIHASVKVTPEPPKEEPITNIQDTIAASTPKLNLPEETPPDKLAMRIVTTGVSGTTFISAAVQKVRDMELPPDGAAFFENVASSHSSNLSDILTLLGRGAADLLGALKPAASIAGPLLVVAELALKQVLNWHAVSVNCANLRSAIEAIIPLVKNFAESDDLVGQYGALLVLAGRCE